jgi:hypothetical protein
MRYEVVRAFLSDHNSSSKNNAVALLIADTPVRALPHTIQMLRYAVRYRSFHHFQECQQEYYHSVRLT